MSTSTSTPAPIQLMECATSGLDTRTCSFTTGAYDERILRYIDELAVELERAQQRTYQAGVVSALKKILTSGSKTTHARQKREPNPDSMQIDGDEEDDMAPVEEFASMHIDGASSGSACKLD